MKCIQRNGQVGEVVSYGDHDQDRITGRQKTLADWSTPEVDTLILRTELLNLRARVLQRPTPINGVSDRDF